jgi:hypothetical protein
MNYKTLHPYSIKLKVPYFESNTIPLFARSNGFNIGNSWFFVPLLQMHCNKESRIYLAGCSKNVRNISDFTENFSRLIQTHTAEKNSGKLKSLPKNSSRHLTESNPGTSTSISFRTCGQSIHSKNNHTLIVVNASFFQN